MIARNWRLRAVGGLCAAALTVGLAAVVTAPPAQAAFITSNAQRAVNYAVARGERAAVAVLDTETGSFYGAGSYNALMPTESVVKVFIATRLLLTGKMHGSVARTAYKMITQSDDASATALYGRVGGDGLVPWVARHYHLPSLGSAFAHFGFNAASSDYAVWWPNGAPQRRDIESHELGRIIVDGVLGPAAAQPVAARGACLARTTPASSPR